MWIAIQTESKIIKLIEQQYEFMLSWHFFSCPAPDHWLNFCFTRLKIMMRRFDLGNKKERTRFIIVLVWRFWIGQALLVLPFSMDCSDRKGHKVLCWKIKNKIEKEKYNCFGWKVQQGLDTLDSWTLILFYYRVTRCSDSKVNSVLQLIQFPVSYMRNKVSLKRQYIFNNLSNHLSLTTA